MNINFLTLCRIYELPMTEEEEVVSLSPTNWLFGTLDRYALAWLAARRFCARRKMTRERKRNAPTADTPRSGPRGLRTRSQRHNTVSQGLVAGTQELRTGFLSRLPRASSWHPGSLGVRSYYFETIRLPAHASMQGTSIILFMLICYLLNIKFYL